jgi:hypothetical protein
MLNIFSLTVFDETLSQLSYIAHGNVDGLINKIILKCPVLTSLDLRGNLELRCRAFKNIGSFKLMKYLDVSGCTQLDKRVMKYVYVAAGCPSLELLDVSGIPLTDGMFRQILRCRKLQNLFMRECDLSHINLNLIPTNISGLSYIYIGPHLQLRDDVISDMKSQMPHLTIKKASVLPELSEYSHIKRNYMLQYFSDDFVSSLAAK